MTIRLLIADDHPVVRDGLRNMLMGVADFEVVGEAATGAEAVVMVERLEPDVVLMDLRMPQMDGVAATAGASTARPSAAARTARSSSSRGASLSR